MANEVSIWIRARDYATGVFKKFERTLNGTVRLTKQVARDLLAAGAGTAAFVFGMQQMAEAGAKANAVETTFINLVGDRERALRTLRAETRNLVSDQQLMTQANLALTTGAAKSNEEFGRMANQAIRLGRGVGLDATTAVEKFTVALSRQSKLRLDDLGIILDVTKANEDHAASLSKSTDALTDEEKATAFRNAAMEEADELLDRIGDNSDVAAEASERFKASIDNLKTSVQQLVAESPKVAAFFNEWAQILREVQDPGAAERDAFRASLENLPDVNALLQRRRDLLGEIAEKEVEVFKAQARVSSRERRGLISDPALDDALAIARQELAALQREAAVVGDVLTERATAERPAENPDDDGGTGFVAGGGLQTSFRAGDALLTRIDDTRDSLKAANLNLDLATTAEEAGKAKTEVEALTAQLTAYLAMSERFGGEGGLRLARSENAGVEALDVSGRQSNRNPLGFGPDPQLGSGRVLPFDFEVPGIEAIEGPAEDLRGKAEGFEQAGAIASAALTEMASVAQHGSEVTARSVTNMIASIVSSIPGGGIFGSIIGGIGGLIFGGGSKPMPVKVEDYGASAERKLRDSRSEPQNITNVYELGGLTLEEIEYGQRDRDNRDERQRVRPPRRG